MSLPQTVCEYEDVFPDELPRLPSHRDVDFIIELLPGTSPISMTPHRSMLSCRNSKSNYKNCWIGVLLDRALHLGHFGVVFQEEGQDPSSMYRLLTVEQG